MRRVTVWGFLLLANLAAAIGVVYVKHANQAMFKQIQERRQAYLRLQADWSRLLLEQGALASYSRIEKLARQQGMHRPELSKIKACSIHDCGL